MMGIYQAARSYKDGPETGGAGAGSDEYEAPLKDPEWDVRSRVHDFGEGQI
jgi:hypothetical protein